VVGGLSPEILAVLAALAAGLVAALAEVLHSRRVHRLAPLAFGPAGQPELWARLAPAARVLATAAAAWGLITLASLPPQAYRSGQQRPQAEYHLMLLLDVSPSMLLKDAGPTGKQTRRQRAADLLRSFFRRVDLERYRVTVVAVYNGAKPVVVDTRDPDVVDNILDDLPLHFGFEPGETRLGDGLKEAVRLARPWKPQSTIMLIVTDGDTVPVTSVPKLPASIRGVLVVGVGDPAKGKFIAGHMSRQQRSVLRHLAFRLGGQYHDGNEKHIPSELVAAVAGSAWEREAKRRGRREWALAAVAAGSGTLALLPLLLIWAGTRWRPGRPAQRQGQRGRQNSPDTGSGRPTARAQIGPERPSRRQRQHGRWQIRHNEMRPGQHARTERPEGQGSQGARHAKEAKAPKIQQRRA